MDRDRERRLPRLGDDAVMRTFDAPEALDIRFHEVRAKSALNAVPKQSRMPFRWTINPYRGCSHACSYCGSGETPMLMYDGHTKPLADVRIGDEIYGTVREGGRTRYVASQVIAHWETVKPGFRTILGDDTELVTSGDHRFLTPDGWKFVTGTEHERAFLVPTTGLMGGAKRTPRLSIAGSELGSDDRASRALDRTDRPRPAALRHHHDHRRLHRERRREPQLLRPPHAHLPRPRRRPRLRARDRRQGQRAGGAARRAREAVVEARAGRARARTPTRTSGSRAATS